MITKRKMNSLAMKKKVSNGFFVVFRYLILITLSFAILSPLYQVFKEGITNHLDLGLKNSAWIPARVSKESFSTAMLILDYKKALLYSVVNTLVIAVLQTACATIAAYSFARLKFRGSNILFGLVIFTIIVPPQSVMLAQYIELRNFDVFGLFKLLTGSPKNLLGSVWAQYVLAASGVGIKGGLYIFLLRQSYRQLPVSVEEAAYVDGAGFLRTFFKIVIPSVRPTMLTVIVLSFVWNYADTYYSSLFNSANRLNLALRLSNIQGKMKWTLEEVQDAVEGFVLVPDSPYVQTGVASACACLVIIPLIVLYAFVQKKFVQGVERSGLGGD